MKKKIQEFIESGLVATTDPVELHILYHLERLMHQNRRLRNYVQKSGVWANLKKINKWKPFDFLQYFCNLYQEKYKKSYKVSGNIVKAYQKIELFMQINDISNEEFKSFIDLAFARYFNDMRIPVLGSICSAALYSHLMNRSVRQVRSEDMFRIDQEITKETEEFEEYIDDSEDLGLDEDLAQESERIKRLREQED